jgi:predicted flap endonuclease-1-like 5' DNA nuclease
MQYSLYFVISFKRERTCLMSKFFPGFLVGVSLGVLLAPMPGQDLRQVVIKRMQKLRGSTSDDEQSGHLVLQTSGSRGRLSSILRRDSKPTQGVVNQYTNETQQIPAESTQTDKDSSDAVTTTVPSPLAVSPSQIADPRETFSLNTPLSAIPGMEPEVQSALEGQGIGTLQQLLDRTPTKQERTDLAHRLGLGVHRLKSLTDRADLMRLQGVDGDIATMLEEAGVNGCKDLQNRNPEHLHASLTELYEKKQIALPPPEVEQLMQWIAEAMGVAVTGQE